MTEERLISADSHFVEPPSMWIERVDKKFRDRAPHTVKDLGGRGGEWFVCENITPMSVAGFFGAGVASQDLPAHARKTFEEAPKSVWDAKYRIEDQDAMACWPKSSIPRWERRCSASTTQSFAPRFFAPSTIGLASIVATTSSV